MDRDTRVTPRSPHPGGDATRLRGTDWPRIEDWLTEHALAAATTAEDELALDWARHCARRRHDPARRGLRTTATDADADALLRQAR